MSTGIISSHIFSRDIKEDTCNQLFINNIHQKNDNLISHEILKELTNSLSHFPCNFTLDC